MGCGKGFPLLSFDEMRRALPVIRGFDYHYIADASYYTERMNMLREEQLLSVYFMLLAEWMVI